MSVNKLTPVPRAQLTQLRDLYLIDWPRNCVGFYTLDNFIRWFEKDPESTDLSILCLNGDWSDGTFIVIDRYQIFLNSLTPSSERLTTALWCLRWWEELKLSSFLERHRPAVLSILDRKRVRKQYDSLTLVYHLPRDEAARMEFDCPDGMVLRELEDQHASEVNEAWPNKYKNSLAFIRLLIERNSNVGLFLRDTDELIAWCLRLQGGFLGAFQVKDSHQRKGLGNLVLRAMCNKMGKMGHDATACVDANNVASRKTFEKCGFKVIDKAYWVRTFAASDIERAAMIHETVEEFK